MAKKSAKIAATYFITIIISLLVVGCAGYYAMISYFNKDDSESSINPMMTEANTARVNDGSYEPSAADGITALVIYEAEKKQTSVSFALVRLAPTDSKIIVVPLQTDIRCELNGKSNTLYEFYRLGGTADAKKAAENALKINIDRYIKFTRDNFTEFSDKMGNVTYDVPYNLIYDDASGEDIVIKQGEHILDSGSLRKVLCYPNYNGGEEYRAKVVATLAVSLINSGCAGMLKDDPEGVFSDVMNSGVETDITRYDYDEKSIAFEYILDNRSYPAEMVIPSGVYAEDGSYDLDESFITALPSWLYME